MDCGAGLPSRSVLAMRAEILRAVYLFDLGRHKSTGQKFRGKATSVHSPQLEAKGEAQGKGKGEGKESSEEMSKPCSPNADKV